MEEPHIVVLPHDADHTPREYGTSEKYHLKHHKHSVIKRMIQNVGVWKYGKYVSRIQDKRMRC